MAQTQVGGHLLANFLGRGSAVILSLLVTPICIHFLGIEAYGLIGFYTAITTFFYVFDFGLGDTFCREAARLHTNKKNAQEMRDILRTLETFYWIVGILLSCVLLIFAPWICKKWLHSKQAFSTEQLCHILRLMAFSLFGFWPFVFYCKGLLGLQEHLLYNCILFSSSVIRYLGTALVLFIKPTIEYFFYWQIFSTFLQTALVWLCTWKKLSMFSRPSHFSLNVLMRFWKFSLNMSAIGVTSIILLQTDKLVVSKLFSLEILGYYCFSSTIASSLYYLIQPLDSVYYPIFVQCVERNRLLSLKKCYHTACQLVILIVSPFAFLLIFFGKQVIYLWTSNLSLANTCAPLVALITLGIFLNCCMHMPFFLQAAFGNVKLTVMQNVISIVILIPVLCLLSDLFGILGAASFYILLNGGYILLIIPRLHKKFLITEKTKWYKDDLFIPIIAGSALSFICFYLFNSISIPIHVFVSLIFIYCLILLAISFATPLSRQWIFRTATE